jgi:two-component system, NtrC family, nitrogen regulation response regulator NtrX
MTSILVVEDDPEVRELIRDVLDSEGFEVDTAADGQSALEKAAARRPSLVVLDLTLPLLSGPELAAQLSRLVDGPIPILVISGDGLAASKAQEMGAFGYLHKPFEIDDLVQSVSRALAAS